MSSLTGNRPVIPSCKKCKDEEAAEEVRQWQRKTEFAKMNIGSRYHDVSFENFDAYSPELKKHLAAAERFARSPQGKLIMLGNNGTGKNHLAVSILKQTGGVIYTAEGFSLMLRKNFRNNGNSGIEDSEWEILERISRINLLVLDEIGRSKGSPWEKNWLSYLLNARHERMLPTVIISNNHFDFDCETGGCPKCLSHYLGQDVISRLMEDGIIMKFTSGDYRLMKGNQFRAELDRQT